MHLGELTRQFYDLLVGDKVKLVKHSIVFGKIFVFVLLLLPPKE